MTEPNDTRAEPIGAPSTFAIQIKNPQAIRDQMSAGRILDASEETMTKIATAINSFSDGLLHRIKSVGDASVIKLEFGVNAGGKAGIPLITEGKIDAHLTVTVEWKLR